MMIMIARHSSGPENNNEEEEEEQQLKGKLKTHEKSKELENEARGDCNGEHNITRK